MPAWMWSDAIAWLADAPTGSIASEMAITNASMARTNRIESR